MSSDIDPWRQHFPDLFREGYVDYADCRIQYATGVPTDALVSRLHVVAVTPDEQVVICRSAQGWRGDSSLAGRASRRSRCATWHAGT